MQVRRTCSCRPRSRLGAESGTETNIATLTVVTIPSPAPTLSVSWIVLTQGDRPLQVAAAVNGVLAHDPPPLEVIVVGNGRPVDVSLFDKLVGTVDLPDNVGIPAGRNVGAAQASGDVLVFLDDDAETTAADTTGKIAQAFAEDSGLGAMSFLIRDPESGAVSSRHVPTVGGRHPERVQEVTTFLGGACAIRRAAFEACGRLPGQFFYAHEETDLAWRMLDQGWSIRYSPEVAFTHPRTEPSRHTGAIRHAARNRVWLAKRNLPILIAPVYVLVWTAITALRGPSNIGAHLGGTLEGLRQPCPPRRPISWRTVWRMTQLKRPPII